MVDGSGLVGVVWGSGDRVGAENDRGRWVHARVSTCSKCREKRVEYERREGRRATGETDRARDRRIQQERQIYAERDRWEQRQAERQTGKGKDRKLHIHAGGRETEEETLRDRHTKTQTDKHTNIQKNGHRATQADIQTHRQINTQTYRHTDTHTYKHTYIRTGKRERQRHPYYQGTCRVVGARGPVTTLDGA